MRHVRPILALAALFCLPLFAEDTPPAGTPAPVAAPKKTAKKDRRPSPARAAPAGAANVIVAKDPVTGELRPATAAEREQLLGRRPLVSPAPEIVTFPDGTVMMKERPEDANYAVATRNADGTLSYACVRGADAARAAAAPAPSPAPKSADR
jgi:hypothetical protein